MTPIVLHLGAGRCIQGAARQEHQRLVAALLATQREPTADEAAQVELLAEFLSHTDFRTLRSTQALLAGASETQVELTRNEQGVIELRVNDVTSDRPDARGERS